MWRSHELKMASLGHRARSPFPRLLSSATSSSPPSFPLSPSSSPSSSPSFPALSPRRRLRVLIFFLPTLLYLSSVITMAQPSQSRNLTAPNGVSIDTIKYNEAGLITLRQYLGEGWVYQHFKKRFDAADTAWFTEGVHADGRHALNVDTFHEDWFTARETSGSDTEARKEIRVDVKTRLLNLLLDTATMLDRVTGSSTFIASNEPTVIPGQSLDLENVRVHVYVPPHVFAESTRVERALGEIVQKYVEALGLPSVRRWHRAFANAGYRLPPVANKPVLRRRTTPLPFMPFPKHGTSHYLCHGRPLGEIEHMLEQAPTAPDSHDRDGPSRRAGLVYGQDEDEPFNEPAEETASHSQPPVPYEDPQYLRLLLCDRDQQLADKEVELKQLRRKLKATEKRVEELLAAQASTTARSSHATSMPTSVAAGGTHRGQPATPPAPSTATSAKRTSVRAAVLPTAAEFSVSHDPTPSAMSPRRIHRNHDGASSSTALRKHDRDTPSSPTGTTPPALPQSMSPTVSSVSSQLSMMSFTEASSPNPPSTPRSRPELSQWALRSPSPAPLTWHSIVGPTTDAVIRELGLREPGIHRELRRIIQSYPMQHWAQVIYEKWGYDDAVVEELVAAIDIVPAPIQRAKRTQVPSLSREQRAEATAARKVKQASVEEDIEGWYNDTLAFAEDLSARFGSTPEHYLNMMFSGMHKLRSVQRKPNAYNAWLHHLAKEHGDMSAAQLVDTYGNDYQNLTAEQKEEYIQELLQDRESQLYGLRLGQRARVQDVNHVCKAMDDSLMALQARVGIQAFYCVVRSNVEYQLKPRWFFTAPALKEFLRGSIRKFEPERIGVLAEAFSIAGSDFFSQLRTNKEKVQYLKSEIRAMIAQGLISVTGDDNATMSYAQYTRDIQLKYGVALVGWTHPKWCNPSDLGNGLDDLKKLRDALKGGLCSFVRLSPERKAEIQREYDLQQRDVASTDKEQVGNGKARKSKKRPRVVEPIDEADADV
ncbi:hypothetical protein ACG7TL_001789 [Trametes sanguinea]